MASGPPTLADAWVEIGRTVGVPTVIALLVLTQTTPKLDRVNLTLERVDTSLTIMATSCATLTRPN
jgi:hypothetical protein